MTYEPAPNVIILNGQTITKVTHDNATMSVTLADGRAFHWYHDQDCCESVGIDSVKGDWSHLLDTPLISVEETILHGEDPADLAPDRFDKDSYRDSFTWTTFVFTTAKGTVAVRWLGESNGYYSESVSFQAVK